MIYWSAIKLFLGGAWKFVAANWRILLLAALVAFALYETNARKKAEQKLTDFKLSIETAAAAEIASQALKAANAKNAVDGAVSVAALDFANFDLDRSKSTKSVKDLYEKPRPRYVPTDASSMLPTGNNTEPAAQIAEIAKRLAASESKCNAAIARERSDYKTLEDACTITTSDFNVCRAVVDADTLMYGREE